MKEAVIVSTARTGIGRAIRGSLNATRSPSMTAHVISHAVARSGVDPAEIEDVVIGCVLAAGTAGGNLARNALLAAGLPASVSGHTIDRQCASGLMAVATAAKQVMVDGMDIVVAGGHDNITAVQEGYIAWVAKDKDVQVLAHSPHAYMPMLQTAEYVAKKYGITREAQDRYALASQQRTAAAQAAGRFDAEIVPFSTSMNVIDKTSNKVTVQPVTLSQDEGNRPDTTLDGLMSLKPVIEGGVVTAGNASQLSDGASACVIMDSSLAQRRGIAPMGIYRGMAVSG
ncbi:MAG: acetyl-CoA C-acyltransferase, partial [Alcaligenaceae bacterium]